MITNRPLSNTNPLRDTITNAYRMDEAECLERLIPAASFAPNTRAEVMKTAEDLVIATREYKKKQSKIDALLHQYDLSTEEGISLMCLAEALLRIPDKATMDKFISDKLSNADWKNHLSRENPLFINAATWSLLLTGTIYAPALNNEESMFASLKRTTSRLGAAVIRPIILQMMKAIGTQFVMGQNIDEALKRAEGFEAEGYRFSYDMLGEAARTREDAKAYYDSYVTAIDAIGKAAKAGNPPQNPGISIKLSALHPRYEYTRYEQVMEEMPPMLLALAKQAKQYNIGLTVDAEEADRLDLSLDIFEKVFSDPALDGWEGFGLAVQAYQKRASFVIDWLADLSKRHQKRIMVRLVKGAYWDAEIKLSQVQGFSNYPVFTRKNSTDVSYLACARKLLSLPERFYSQFGTHNAYSVAAIMEIAGSNTNFEFQCLHGMGEPLYHQIVDKNKFNRPCRIYAPVGTHKDLLGYLVRRLLENGANSSFVNKLADDTIPMDKIVYDPAERIAALQVKPHPHIPNPRNIYGKWANSEGIDLSNTHVLAEFAKRMEAMVSKEHNWSAGPIINGKTKKDSAAETRLSPNNLTEIIGTVTKASPEDVDEALKIAAEGTHSWGETSFEERAIILEKAAEGFQAAMPELVAMLNREAGKSILDSISEVRETIDYCRYYAYRAREDLRPHELPGPTGESNILILKPRGVIACISPWNFPLAIFAGQIIAGLATGNTVLAKPAEQTPLIAYKAVQILQEAGVPPCALQLLIGRGSVVGAKIVNDERVAGVMFTGSTETAKFIERSLANRNGPIAVFIAETGGQNAMIVDSSALAEQTVADVVTSAFNSAGQRCSALRVLFVQDDIAPKIITMLEGYMADFNVGDPGKLANDIGPVIDEASRKMLEEHYAKMKQAGKLIAQIPVVKDAPRGNYFTPAAFEIEDLGILEGEVFGPILHIIRFKAGELDKVMNAIINTGYGLTLGIHSRIDAVSSYVANRMPVGNIYINRNMVGAVVGVQPFGGERLSGTGPKAGGPHYLPRLCVERTISTNTTAVGGNARLVSLLEDD
ncbi:MAG TPA: bifunctional proline dehydrogenase/L-glutamate gamma-semialdehyde dehydrogenase PutA [Gammaproteobacteria bacterium]|nr:bifunctional proline dehydrogenase/L-glutamate gamma-semialdehyde dehydrogenase PutA [Gammaproteobacteria bacterium]